MECSIRKWRMEDAADLAKALNNSNIQDHLRDGLPFPYTVKDAEEFITTILKSDQEAVLVFAITVENRAIGSIGIFRQSNIHCQTAEMGYYIAEKYWGNGIGTSAIKQACGHVFEQTDIIRIFAEPFAYNSASCRILEKCGFTLEGVLRSNAVKKGKVLDMKLYSLLKTEYGETGLN